MIELTLPLSWNFESYFFLMEQKFVMQLKLCSMAFPTGIILNCAVSVLKQSINYCGGVRMHMIVHR